MADLDLDRLADQLLLDLDLRFSRDGEDRKAARAALADAHAAGRRAGLAEVAKQLDIMAAKYQQDDGEPGPLGFNCWGWRDIAKTYRNQAAAIRDRLAGAGATEGTQSNHSESPNS